MAGLNKGGKTKRRRALTSGGNVPVKPLKTDKTSEQEDVKKPKIFRVFVSTEKRLKKYLASDDAKYPDGSAVVRDLLDKFLSKEGF